ncbi:hypothetical protein DVG78_10865 [Runella aurantiaca]|uniref:Uncharacterized protein n=2 Tax=Runella aurantiaca TaxID=2282308 RepID=A0A369IEH9_9BACT|nr:hypothetical protein DVG78_10865 [Runella aurantiaca]
MVKVLDQDVPLLVLYSITLPAGQALDGAMMLPAVSVQFAVQVLFVIVISFSILCFIVCKKMTS